MQVHQTKIWVKDSHKRQRGTSYDYTYYIHTHTHKQKFESKIVTRDKEGHHMIIHITHTHTHTQTHTHTVKLSVFQHSAIGEAWRWDWRRVVTRSCFSGDQPPHPTPPPVLKFWGPQDPCVVILAFKRLQIPRLWWLCARKQKSSIIFTVLDPQYLIYCKCMWILS